jgi:hypothetical protein
MLPEESDNLSTLTIAANKKLNPQKFHCRTAFENSRSLKVHADFDRVASEGLIAYWKRNMAEQWYLCRSNFPERIKKI